MDWNGLKRDWRIWLLVLSLVASFALVFNITDPYTRDRQGDIVLDTNIKQGLDLQGGARVLINLTGENVTQETVDQTIDTLETRISAFGLQDMSIRPVQVGGRTYIQIELAGANTSDLTELINRTGKFESRMPITVADDYTFTLGEGEYTAQLADDGTVTVGGKTVEVNDTFTLSSGPREITFTYTNYTGSRAVLSALAFTGDDMLGVDISSQVSSVSYNQRSDSWSFRFQNSLTQEAAERVMDIAQAFETRGGYLVSPVTGERAQTVLILDGNVISSLSTRDGFKDSPVKQPVITGSEQTREDALTEMNQLQSVLKSGALPTSIEIVQTTRVSATLGQQFLQTAITAIIVAILAVALVVFLRYRDPQIVVPLTLTGFSELAMIFGFAAAVGWTIDLPSIAGIIAAVGTGVDDQIIITDERGKQSLQSFKKRFKRAFFIIFTSAASTIGAMLPLTRIGAGEITGFAVTTIAGILIGVAITRPAYARVLQYMER